VLVWRDCRSLPIRAAGSAVICGFLWLWVFDQFGDAFSGVERASLAPSGGGFASQLASLSQPEILREALINHASILIFRDHGDAGLISFHC
jgi:hypothetical protein